MHTITLILVTLIDITASPAPTLEPDGIEMKDGQKKKKTARERFDALDTDHDGKITLAEFVAGHKEEKSTEAAEVFARIDTDGDGSLTPEEFKAEAKARKEQRKQGE